MQWATISIDGHVDIREGKPSLEDLQAAVGGYVQVIPPLSRDGDEAVIWMDEEGKVKGIRVNETADWLVRSHGPNLMPGDRICGPVALTGPADDEGETTTLSEQWTAYLRDLPVSFPV